MADATSKKKDHKTSSSSNDTGTKSSKKSKVLVAPSKAPLVPSQSEGTLNTKKVRKLAETSKTHSSSTEVIDKTIKQELVTARKELEKEKRKTKTLKSEIDEASKNNLEEIKKLRSEIESLKHEAGIDSDGSSRGDADSDVVSTSTEDEARRKSVVGFSDDALAKPDNESEGRRHSLGDFIDHYSVKATISKFEMRRPSDASDAIGSQSGPTRRSKDDLILNLKRSAPASSQVAAVLDSDSVGAITRPRRGSKVIVDIEQKPARTKSPHRTRSNDHARRSNVDSRAESTSEQVKNGDASSQSSGGAPPTDESTEEPTTPKDGSAPGSPRSSSRPVLQRRQESKSLKVSSHSIKITTANVEAGTMSASSSGPSITSSKSTHISVPSTHPSGAATIGRNAKLSKLLGVDDLDSAVQGAKGSPTSPRDRSSLLLPSPVSTPSSSSATSPHFEMKRNVVIQTDQSGAQSIRGGTIGELVRQLIGSSEDEMGVDGNKYMQTFLLTYHSFMTSLQFLQRLEEAFQKAVAKSDSAIQQRVIKILNFWLDDRSQDLVTNDDVSGAFVEFVSKKVHAVSADEAGALVTKLETKSQAHWRRVKKHMQNSPSRDGSSVNRDFLSFKPTAIANELTMIFSELYQRIEPMEFLTHGKSKPGDKPSRIGQMIQQFNNVAHWIATEIVRREDLNKRWKVLAHVIKVALECQELQNYDGTMSLLSGLELAAVFRLKLTWAKLEEEKPKTMQRYRALQALMSQDENNKHYRGLINNVKPPGIPYIAMYLKDITFINDGNPDTLEADFGKADFINFDKRQKLANVILEIRRFQVVPYDVKRDSLFRRYLENIDILEDIALYNQSLVAEARAKKTGSAVMTK